MQRVADVGGRVRPDLWAPGCTRSSSGTDFSGLRLRDEQTGIFSFGFADYLDTPDYLRRSCAFAAPAANATSRQEIKAADASSSVPSLPSDIRTGRLTEAPAAAAPEWGSLGKNGPPVQRAREEVREILSSPNACSEWFAAKDPDVERTFQSLGFLIDRQGQGDVLAFPLKDASMIVRQPYVARATQDGGANTDITINAYGAFFRSQAKFEKSAPEGGPNEFWGGHWLNVGPFNGNSLEAQTLTILHELGHIVDLLPEDADDLDGKSARNTSEVLRHCRPQIEWYAKQVRQTAKK